MVKDNTHPKLLNFSIDILSPYLSGEFRFVPDREDNGEISYVLKEDVSPHAQTDAKGKTISVIQMRNGYWMGCGYTYFKRKHNKKELKQFCIHLFDEQNPLFRVDWASKDIPESQKHAQPHWHFDTEIKLKTEDGDYTPPTYDEYLRTSRQEKEVIADLGRFHFFMNWNFDKVQEMSVPYLDLSDETIFKPWLTKSMEYINNELLCLFKR